MPRGCADYTVLDQLTRAAISQAEGAIEGRAAQYEMPSPHATNFAFSRFEGARQYVPTSKIDTIMTLVPGKMLTSC